MFKALRKFSFLNFVEKVGNALPHPATLFAAMAGSVLVLSLLAHLTGWTAVHPVTDETIEPVNLLSKEGFHRVLLEMVENFTSFAPLGIVLVAMLGIGMAEGSGLIGALIRKLVLSAPKRLLTFILVFSGILSNFASDIGYVLLIPLAGVIFLSVGRHPVAGMAAAFAGVSGGFSANLILGTIDPLLAGLSTEAAQIVDPNYEVNPTANYFFMIASTFVIAAAGTWVTERIVVPRLGKYEGEHEEDLHPLTKLEKKGLRISGLVTLGIIGVILVGLIPSNGFLRGHDGTILNSPVIEGVVAWLFILAGGAGVAYGLTVGKYKSDTDIVNGMTDSMKTLASYIVLVFFAAQFVAYFKWSNLGLIFAIKGADFLVHLDMGLIPLLIMFVILSATINMFMGSASAKWAVLGPIFIPVFMFLGYSPELSQVVFRIGDSVTNIISPMMSFFALIIAFIQKYDKKAGIGTIISTMLPYTIVFFIAWIILLVIWVWFDIPLGPGVNLHL
ncbi:MAG TPA: AbgT family transporter [Salinivirga sp.]|uniref:AbgT family transporter n=1 Tax=Salinivirga sp. TaxID=1970192 RepID=UPI002B48A397|nr:AbgT family transporter [Salinivirga sp.]HKK59449.1 AbgT family transporter [Salinivirga sp.]